MKPRETAVNPAARTLEVIAATPAAVMAKGSP
jgi:hypothetical protein